MKNNKRKYRYKYALLLVCLHLAVVIAVTGTIAYLFTETDPVTNTFKPVAPGTEIEETLENNVKKDVTVKNTGEVDSYIRAKVIITWQNKDGEVYPKMPVAPADGVTNNDYTISYGNEWILGDDGYFYYTKSVPATVSTNVFISSVTPVNSCEDNTYTLHVEILSQAIQSTPDIAVDVWDNDKVDVKGTNGTLTVTNIMKTDETVTQSE